eukprot:993071-Pelagomonas_calceolata.AAC.1
MVEHLNQEHNLGDPEAWGGGPEIPLISAGEWQEPRLSTRHPPALTGPQVCVHPHMGPQTWHGVPGKYAEQVLILVAKHSTCLRVGTKSHPPILSLRWTRFSPKATLSQNMGQIWCQVGHLFTPLHTQLPFRQKLLNFWHSMSAGQDQAPGCPCNLLFDLAEKCYRPADIKR